MESRTRTALSLAGRLVAGTLFAAGARQVADFIAETAPDFQKPVDAVLGLSVALVFAFLIFPFFRKKSND